MKVTGNSEEVGGKKITLKLLKDGMEINWNFLEGYGFKLKKLLGEICIFWNNTI